MSVLNLPAATAAKLEALRARDPQRAREIAEYRRRIVANLGVIDPDGSVEAESLDRLEKSVDRALDRVPA